MPTLFERIDGTLANNDVDLRVTVQADALTRTATLVTGLIEHPPRELADLGAAVRALPLPDLAISGEYAQALNALAGAVPTDLSGLAGGLTESLKSLEDELGGLSGPLREVLDVVLAIYEATRVDLLCTEETAPTGSGGEGSGTQPAGGNGGNVGAGSSPGGAPAPLFIQQMNGILDLFPQSLDLSSLLDWLYRILRNLNLSDFHIVQVPILDDLRDPLVTLIEWRDAMNAGELLGHMSDTLGLLEDTIAGSVDTVVAPLETALAAVKSQLPTAALVQIADDLAVHLELLRTAVLSGDLSATAPAVTALNTTLDSYAAIRLNVQSNLAAHFAALDSRLKTLDHDLDDQIGRLESLLQPESLLSFIPTPDDLTLAVPGLEDFESWLSTLVEWLGEVTDRLDVSAIQASLKTFVETLQKTVDGLDAAQITVALEARTLFAEVDGLIDQIDPAVLRREVEAAIDGFQAKLANQLQGLFVPVREAASAAITRIGDGVQSFDPADVVDALKDALDKLAGVLEHPEVLAAMKDIRAAIDGTARALDAASFAPLADRVIAEIDKLTAAFQALDTSKLSLPVQGALQLAVQILPKDLTPFSGPLLDRLGRVVVEGPHLQALRQQTSDLVDRVRTFEPGTLLGDKVSAPYQALLSRMNAFKPSAWLGLAAAELETLKARLNDNANPARLLASLEPPFTSLLNAFDRLEPAKLIEPVETVIQGAIGTVVDTLPVDATFAQLNAVLQAVERVTQIGTGTIAVLQRGVGMLNGFADPRAQMDAWMEAILASINNVVDASPLQPALDAVEAALDSTTAAGLTARFDTSAVDATLAALDPRARLVKVVQAYNGVPRSRLEALPGSPEKTAILAVLDRFNPLDPAFGPPFQKAAELQTGLAEAHTRLATRLLEWDSRHHEAGSLVALRNLQATPENLRAWIGDALEDKIGRPIVAVLSLAEPMAQVLGAFVSKLQELITALTGKLTALLAGPASLGAIRTAIQALLDKLKSFNLDFLTRSLGDVFANLRGKFDAIHPAALRQSVETAFNGMLAALRIDLLIPAAQIAELDAAYQGIVDDLKALAPETLVVKVVQPEFDKKIVPLLEVFDPARVLDALHDRLVKIEEELLAEMARVNEAYQKLRESIPSLSVSVGLPF